MGDYAVVREELRLYNPEYVTRPHILALNKMDLEWAALRTEELREGVAALDEARVGAAPIAVVPVSAARGDGVDALVRELGKLMREEDDARVREIKGDAPRARTTGEGTKHDGPILTREDEGRGALRSEGCASRVRRTRARRVALVASIDRSPLFF